MSIHSCRDGFYSHLCSDYNTFVTGSATSMVPWQMRMGHERYSQSRWTIYISACVKSTTEMGVKDKGHGHMIHLDIPASRKTPKELAFITICAHFCHFTTKSFFPHTCSFFDMFYFSFLSLFISRSHHPRRRQTHGYPFYSNSVYSGTVRATLARS